MPVEKVNVGRIAERIAMNEMEARSFHIIDLTYNSKTSANVDFIASKNGASLYVQVKGTSIDGSSGKPRWAVQYGYCTQEHIDQQKNVYNSKTEFALKANVIVLVSVVSPSNYRAIVLPVDAAERAAQMNLDGYYRQMKLNGDARKPSKIFAYLEAAPNARKFVEWQDQERKLLAQYDGAWDSLDTLLISANPTC